MIRRPIALAFILVVVGACSIDPGSVVNKPPAINAEVTTQLRYPEFGKIEFTDPMDMDGVSMFFWPTADADLTVAAEPAPNCVRRMGKGLDSAKLSTSDKMSLKVCQVNTYSGAIDAAFAGLQTGLPVLAEKFRAQDCAALATNSEVVISDEIEWQTLEPNDPREVQVLSCKELKEKHAALVAETFASVVELKTKLLGEIGPANWLEVDKQLSMVTIAPGNIELTFKVGAITYSTTSLGAQLISNASYDARFRLLRFEFNELDSDRKPTGSVYKFTLERIEALGMARFTGDVKLVGPRGQIRRNGSAQISGHLVP